MKRIAVYNNGNYQVQIFEDGTKHRLSLDGTYVPIYPETIDLNISYYCRHNCPYCYIDASLSGKHGNLSLPILDQIKPYTELAINYAEHPDLENFLERMKLQEVICNLTVNERDLPDLVPYLNDLTRRGLIYGIGVSVRSSKALEVSRGLGNNVVFHTIVGITPLSTVKSLLEANQKVLFLGYKVRGRGITTSDYKARIASFADGIGELLDIESSGILSFDNLALDQLGVRSKIPKEIWDSHYMGNEGSFSMYIDTVTGNYYKSSIEESGFSIGDKSLYDIFSHVRSL